MEHTLEIGIAIPKPPKNIKDLFSDQAQQAVSSNLMILSCGDSEDKQEVMETLEFFAENISTLLEIIKETLNTEEVEEEDLIRCINLIEKLGKTAFELLPDLGLLLDSPSWKIRQEVLKAIGKMGRIAKSLAPYVAEVARNDKYPVIRDIATETLNLIS